MSDEKRTEHAGLCLGWLCYVALERPPWVPAMEWLSAVIKELGYADWMSAARDPRIQRGDFGQIDEAIRKLKDKLEDGTWTRRKRKEKRRHVSGHPVKRQGCVYIPEQDVPPPFQVDGKQ